MFIRMLVIGLDQVSNVMVDTFDTVFESRLGHDFHQIDINLLIDCF